MYSAECIVSSINILTKVRRPPIKFSLIKILICVIYVHFLNIFVIRIYLIFEVFLNLSHFRVEGLQAIIITDRDGVPILKSKST